jgi:DNA topoisomerase-1
MDMPAAERSPAGGRPDARGRKQYRYHSRWRGVRDAGKYGKVVVFGKVLPKICARVERDLSRRGLPREKVLAAIARLLETTMMRVGNEELPRPTRAMVWPRCATGM